MFLVLPEDPPVTMQSFCAKSIDAIALPDHRTHRSSDSARGLKAAIKSYTGRIMFLVNLFDSTEIDIADNTF